jgi:hypothetical protein
MAQRAARPTSKHATRKREAGAARKGGRERVTPAARTRAAALAANMPFVHFPAGRRLSEWKSWGAFRSRVHQGMAPPSQEPFDILRASHVFAYAGPCCFAAPEHFGDVAAYMNPALDTRGRGAVSPFDSGALEGDDARLQPWARRSKQERWRFLQRHMHPLASWRRTFEQWLLYCYASPERYLECSEDRYAAGRPERKRPLALREHNGVSGRARYGEEHCADRRAWTWEARFEEPLPFSEIRLLHVPADRLQVALEAVQVQLFEEGNAPRVLPLSEEDVAPGALYLRSPEALEEFITP